MGFDAQDKEIVRLLTKLKEVDGKYPPELLAARRRSYLKQMGQIGLGIGAGLKIKSALNGAKAPTLSSATSTILESALVVAIVAETGTVAYFYRDKIAGVFKSITRETKVQEVTPSPASAATELEVQGIKPSPAVTATLPSATVSVSPTDVEPTSTPVPEVVEDNATTAALEVKSTPAPKNNNGNHYGQTPKPQRIKETKNNNNQAPKDNSKLPKTK